VSVQALGTTLEERAERALGDEPLRKAVRFTVDRLRSGKQQGVEAIGHFEELRELGRQIRKHTITNLDYYLERFAAQATARGVQLHFARDAAEATAHALRIVAQKHARTVVKSKSMLSEEIHLNDALAAAGVDCVETDLGEWIVQLAGETPSHIILPAIHKTRAQVQTLFEAEGKVALSPDTATLAAHARRRLRERFATAEVGITGCNFAVAETGSVVVFTNEGNGRMVTCLPDTHIVMMGMERIVPSWDELEVMAQLLPRSATGQKLTTYLNVLSGPRRTGELDGAREMHVIVVDNGRSAQLGDPEFEDILNCIRCGACLNVCPVYRQIGGHAYGTAYSGPIGAVLTPLLLRDKPSAELAQASTLCGACTEACPVKIPLHDMLVSLRVRSVAAGDAPRSESIAFRLFAWVFGSSGRLALASRLARALQRFAQRTGLARMALRRAPFARLLKHRELPKPAARTFRDAWAEEQHRRRDV
jgi:L-lactate dehydrogenase complex protein LldF